MKLNERLYFAKLARLGRKRSASARRLMNPNPPLLPAGELTGALAQKRTETLLQEFARLGLKLSAASTAEDAARTIVAVAHRLLGWEGCAIDIYQQEQRSVYPILTMDVVNGAIVDVPPAATDGKLTPWARRAIEKGAHLILRRKDGARPRGFVPFGDTSRMSASIMVAPIRNGAKVTGIMSLHSYTYNAYTKADLNVMQSLADHCGGALERIWAQEALREREKQLRALALRAQSAREEEGIRIAREIHDEMGQELTSLKIGLAWMEKKLQTGVHAAVLAEKARGMTEMVDRTLRAVRRISTQLRPRVLDDLGLAAAIEWQTQQFQARTGIRCELAAEESLVTLVRQHATAVFRIYQEILTNVARHAAASRVSVRVEKKGSELILQVRDNGRGITKKEMAGSHSLGLLGMRERALLFGGSVEIEGQRNKGTTVQVRIPIPAAATNSSDENIDRR